MAKHVTKSPIKSEKTSLAKVQRKAETDRAIHAAPTPMQVLGNHRTASAARSASEGHVSPTKRTPVQPKVKVGAANDEFEREADRVAEQVMRMPKSPVVTGGPSPMIRRACAACRQNNATANQQELDAAVRRSSVDSGGAFEANMSPGALTTGGSPLASSVEHFFASRFNSDFSDVRVHTGADAQAQCDAIDAHAFTYKNHIWLGRGQQPHRSHIMAHELAHVVQQRPLNARAATNPVGHTRDHCAAVRPARYWVVGGRAHHMNGNDIQQAINMGQPNGAREEVWIPNGGRSTAATGQARLGVRGRADYYKADQTNARIGVYFSEPVNEQVTCASGAQLATPINLPNGRTSGPRMVAGQLTNSGRAPTDIELGEMKPADPDQVAFGRRQLSAYEAGIRFAVTQANCWWQNQPSTAGATPSWALATNSPRRLTGMNIPSAFQFNAASPGSSRNLSVGEWYGNERVRIVFDPRAEGLPPIQGDLYAAEVDDGIYVHFARPANPRAVFNSLGTGRRGRQRQAWVAEATWVQNHVIQPLLSAPNSVATKRRSGVDSGAAVNHNVNANLSVGAAPLVNTATHLPLIQTNRRPRRLRDSFDNSRLIRWQNDWDSFRRRFTAGTFVRDPAKLQFLDMLYDAEEATTDAGAPPVASAKRLPPRSELRFQYGPNPEDPTGTRGHGRLDRLYVLLDVLSNRPMRRLGALRKRFGSLFVSVGNRLNQVKQRFTGRIDRQGRSARRSGGGWAGIAIKAFWNTALAIGSMVMRQTFNLLTDSLASGLRQKLRAFIPFDDVQELRRQMEEGFPLLTQLQEQFEEIESNMRSRVEELTTWFDGIMEPLRRGTEIASGLGTFIKWALIALQCGTPPGLGCLKLIAQEGLRMTIDWIMSTCLVRRRMAQVVQATGFFTGLPRRISRNIADLVEGLLPDGVAPIFDRTILDQTPENEDLDCDREDVSVIDQGLQDMEVEIGSEMFELVLEAAARYGVPVEREVTVEDLQNIQNSIAESGITADVMREYIRATPRPTSGDTVNFETFVNSVMTRVRERRASQQRRRFDTSWYRQKNAELSPGGWEIEPLTVAEIQNGAAFAKPLIYKPQTGNAVLGVSDIAINSSSLDCSSMTVRITFVNIVLTDSRGSSVDSGLESRPVVMTLTGDFPGLCDTSE